MRTVGGGRSSGLLFALAAYVSWGFLSPVGDLLLERLGPFTLNSLRTLAALPLLFALTGAEASKRAMRSVVQRVDVWVLGAGYLAGTFILFILSLRYLPPTLTTSTVYAAPLLIAAWQAFVEHERVSKWAVPATLATLAGAWLAFAGDATVGGRGLWIGLALASTSVVGWAAYTIHVKRLTLRYDPSELALAAFVTSAVTFSIGAAFEGFRASWDAATVALFVLYVAFPTVLSFWAYNLALARVDATTIAVLLGVELLATAVVSAGITGETFGPTKILGLVVTTMAMTLYLWNEKRRVNLASAA